jgi:hypothetical protein
LVLRQRLSDDLLIGAHVGSQKPDQLVFKVSPLILQFREQPSQVVNPSAFVFLLSFSSEVDEARLWRR